MSIVTQVIDWDKKVVSELNLSEDIFSKEYREDIVKEVIRWQRNKARRATQSVKNRSEVSGAHRKIYAQKGSGRARQGDGKEPHFRGGGIAFGIGGRNYVTKLNKKFKSLALKSVLSYKLAREGIVVVKSLDEVDWSKTSQCSKRIFDLIGEQKVLIISEKAKEMRGVRNLKNVRVIHPDGVNVLSCCPRILLSDPSSMSKLESRLSKYTHSNRDEQKTNKNETRKDSKK